MRSIEFRSALIDAARRKILLIVDNLRVHKAVAVMAWLEDRQDRIELAFLPLTRPNPTRTKYLNSDFKTHLRLATVSENREPLMAKAITLMTRLQTWPERVRSYFQHPAAQYAAEHNLRARSTIL